MIREVKLYAAGIPAPKGSFRVAMNKGARFPKVLKDSEKTYIWESIVEHAAAIEVGDGDPVEGPLEVELEFRLPRPKGHFRKRGGLSAAGRRRPFPTVKPDIDKLSRALLDALEGVVFEHDAEVVRLDAWKLYADDDNPPGCRVRVRGPVTAPMAGFAHSLSCGADSNWGPSSGYRCACGYSVGCEVMS